MTALETLDVVQQRVSDEERDSIAEWVATHTRLQGENRFLGVILENKEEVRSSGIILPNLLLTQDCPHICRVLQLSPKFDNELYPDVKVGAVIVYKPMVADNFEFKRVNFTRCDAEYVRWVHLSDELSPFQQVERDESVSAHTEAIDKFHKMAESDEHKPSIPSMIIVK